MAIRQDYYEVLGLGLPIEHNVEKKLGKAGTKVDFKTFRQKCREYAAQQVEGQKKDFVRLGVIGD